MEFNEIAKTHPNTTIACPVRDRGKILPYYLENIYKQTFPKKNTKLLFVVNNSFDNSEQILKKFKKEHQKEYKNITILRHDRNPVDKRFKVLPEDDRKKNTRRLFINEHLAFIRNYLLDRCDTEWLFSVDSDIMLLPDTLERLLNSNKRCISALICNGHKYVESVNNKVENKIDRRKPTFYTNIMRHNGEGLIHVPSREWNGIIEVDMTGAVYLIHEDIYKKCRYKDDLLGEDIPFCKDVRRLKEKLWCDTDIKLAHIMDEDLLKKYLEGEYTF